MFLPPSDKPVAPPMRCRECNAVIYGLGCPQCLMAKSRAEIVKQQRTYVLPAVEDRYTVTLARWASGNYHIALFGHNRMAFCGKSLRGATKHRIAHKHIATSAGQPYETCRECVAVFNKAVEAARRDGPHNSLQEDRITELYGNKE
jgi:hypothetical protein